MGLVIEAKGDLEIDAHHTVEDVGLALGDALKEALGDKVGIVRYGSAIVPMEDALVQVALDLSGRPYLARDVPVPAERIGDYEPVHTNEFMRALSNRAGITLHIKLLDGRDPHHIVEAEFKALARALGEACSLSGRAGTPVDEGGARVTRAAVIDYDLGNLPSVTKALERIGVDATIVDDTERARPAASMSLVLPGVGHFGAGARNLRDRGFDVAIKDWAAAGKPLLGICVGLQLFMESSEEDPDEHGLGIIKGHVRELTAPKVPHMGWNTLETKPAIEDRCRRSSPAT